jgi:signal transduction histidine kinase
MNVKSPSPSPSQIADRSERGLFGRWVNLWSILAVLMAATGVVVAWLDPAMDWTRRLLALALAGVWVGWYWLAGRGRWKRDSWLLTLSFVAALGVATGLSFIHPAFLLLLFSFYGTSFGSLPIWRAVGVVSLLSVALAARFISLNGGFNQGSLPIIVSFLVSTLFAVLLGFWINAIINQSRERQRMIEELEAARSELAAAERQAGTLAERQRLAGEIHDTLAQGFTSIVMHLEAAEQALEGEQPATRAHLDQARQTAREALAEARRFVWALKPELLERKPLGEALAEVTRRWSAESGIPAGFAGNGAPCPLPAAAEATLLRAAQEGLANAARHAQAHQVNLTLSYMEDEVILDVQDDGQGFDLAGKAPAPGEGGYGLAAMRQRAEQLGGWLLVESAPGEGTTVTMRLPVEIHRGDAEKRQ